MSNFSTTCPLADVLEFREGPGIMAFDFCETGVPLIRIAGLKSGAALTTGCNYLDPIKVQSKWNHFRVHTGDVLLSTSASLGEVAVVDEETAGAIPYTGIVAFRSSAPLVHPSFVRFLLTAATFKDQIDAMGVGSVMRHFGPMHLRKMTVTFPDVKSQIAIAEVVKALDDKVCANLELAAQMNALTQALFKAATADVDTHRAVREVAEFTKGVSYRSDDLKPSTTALVTLKSITRYGTYVDRGLKSYSGPYTEQQAVGIGDIVVAQTDLTQAAEVVGRAVRVAQSSDYEVLVASLDLTIARPRPGTSAEFLLGILSEERFHRHCQSYATGTTVLHLSPEAFQTYLAPVLPAAEQQEFASKVGPLHCLTDSLVQENRSLAALRDNLLPQLVSGRIRVKDAEKQVEEVA